MCFNKVLCVVFSVCSTATLLNNQIHCNWKRVTISKSTPERLSQDAFPHSVKGRQDGTHRTAQGAVLSLEPPTSAILQRAVERRIVIVVDVVGAEGSALLAVETVCQLIRPQGADGEAVPAGFIAEDEILEETVRRGAVGWLHREPKPVALGGRQQVELLQAQPVIPAQVTKPVTVLAPAAVEGDRRVFAVEDPGSRQLFQCSAEDREGRGREGGLDIVHPFLLHRPAYHSLRAV